MIVYNFCIPQGTDLTLPFVLQNGDETPINLSGYTAAMQLRVLVTAEQAVDTLTTDNGRIMIDAAAGKITCSFPHESTEKYPVKTLVYDLEITSSGGEITRIVQGKAVVSAEVTRV